MYVRVTANETMVPITQLGLAGGGEGVKNHTNMHAQQAVVVTVIDQLGCLSNAPPDTDFSITSAAE